MHINGFLARYIKDFSTKELASEDKDTLYVMYKMFYTESASPFRLNENYFNQNRGPEHKKALTKLREQALSLPESDFKRFVRIHGKKDE